MEHNDSSGGVVERLFEMAGARHILIGPAKEQVMSGNIPLYLTAFLGLFVLRFFVNLALPLFRKRTLPVVNKHPWDFWQTKARAAFQSNARQIIREGFEKHGGPFILITDNGEQLMLPPEYIDIVNKEPNLSFQEFIKINMLSEYDTFKNFRPAAPGLFEDAIMKGLTRNLPKFTMALSDEMDRCLKRTWGESTEWHEVYLRSDVLDWVARLSARIFAGPILAEHEEWLRISIDYTVNSFSAMSDLKAWPGPLRWLAERFLLKCRKVRSDYKLAGKIIKPILAERAAEIRLAEKEGRKPVIPDDSIEWFRNAGKIYGPYDDANMQLGIGVAAIHTTSDLLGQCVLNLCKYPEVVEPLREEAVQVLKKFGWQKVALTEVRLLDSFMKETQRVKPIAMVVMNRIAMKDVTLGPIQLRKGDATAITAVRHWSPETYEQPEIFDVARFVKRREKPAHQNDALFVATSKDHVGFSHGKHACPGRFFAANETKIALIHLLLKYDFAIADPKQAEWIESGIQMFANPFAKIKIRRRAEEIDLSQLKP